MTKLRDAKLIYSVILGLFIFAVGLAIICVTADIYYSGKGTGVIYTREIVGARLEKLAIPLVILIAYAIAGVVFPIKEARVKPLSEDGVKKLRPRVPGAGDKEYGIARKNYIKYTAIRIALWSFVLAVTVAGAIYSICYLTVGSHFMGADITAEILELTKHILSWTLASLAVLAAASVANGLLAKKQLGEMKTMIKHGDKDTVPDGSPIHAYLKFADGAKAVASHKITVWSVRGVILVIGVVFIVLGVLNGGAHDVLVKAINICQECIGLG